MSHSEMNEFERIEENTGQHGRVAQWIRRLTTDQEIPGSSPGVVICFPNRQTQRANVMEMPRIELGPSRMLSGRSTTELHPHYNPV